MDDESPVTISSLAVLAFVVILILVFACRFLGPQAASWVRSNKEEKIGLSKNKLFHANGYMIHSGSEFLLSSSGSFKRFDSVDPDFKQPGQHSAAQLTSPLWNLSQTEQSIPPQPLRPAPAPLQPPTFAAKTVTFSFSRQPAESLYAAQEREAPSSVDKRLENRGAKETATPLPIQAPPPRLSAPSTALLSASAIPRPVARRLQAPSAANWTNLGHPNASSHRVTLAQRCELPANFHLSTNPFLYQSENCLAREETSSLPHPLSTPDMSVDVRSAQLQMNGDKNPFHSAAPASNCTTQASSTTDSDSNNDGSSPKSPLATPKQLFRNRSFSETEASDPSLSNFSSKLSAVGMRISGSTNPFAALTQTVKAKGPHMLQKTLSEDFLLRGKPGAAPNGAQGGPTWTFGRAFLRQDSQCGVWRPNGSHSSLGSAGSSMDSINLERATSCDSVNSDASIVLSDLEQPFTQITGYLCVGIQYDKNSMTNDGLELVVSVIEAKEILCPLKVDSFDTFVRIYLVPDQPGAMQTKVVYNTLSPSYNESFSFWLKKQQCRHSLWFHLYHNGHDHTLLGEAEMEIGETPRSGTTWIVLSDLRKSNAKWGEVMFSLSYLPTAERLTVVVVKARNLKLSVQNGPISTEVLTIFVKIYLMNHDKKVLKKRTAHKRKDRCPIFNESVIFSLPPQSLSTVQLRLTVFGVLENATVAPLGHVIVGSCATGKGLRHWHQMLSSLRKPVAMWHILRQAANQPIFTGGTEAVVAAMQSTSAAIRSKRNSIF